MEEANTGPTVDEIKISQVGVKQQERATPIVEEKGVVAAEDSRSKEKRPNKRGPWRPQ